MNPSSMPWKSIMVNAFQMQQNAIIKLYSENNKAKICEGYKPERKYGSGNVF